MNTKIRKALSGRFTIIKIIILYIRFIFTKKDNRIKKYKNAYQGRRCFIVGLGPSLSINDLEVLKKNGEICFAVNRIYELFNLTSWRPDFYYISDPTAATDETVYSIEKMILNDGVVAFYSKNSFDNMPKEAISCRQLDFFSPLYNSKTLLLKKNYLKCKFSKDASKYIYDGMTCILSVIQLAYYMGFEQVILLGCDCGTSKGREYGEGLKKRKKQYYDDENNRALIADYASLYNDMQKKQIKMRVFNATRGGKLEVFERVSLESVCSWDEKDE